MNLRTLDRHFESVEKATSPAEVCHSLVPIFAAYQVVSLEPEGFWYWRSRKTEGRPWETISEMSHPQPSIAKVGRLNDSGAPKLYAADNPATALLETNVEEGDIVQLIAFREIPDQFFRFGVVGELHHVMKRGALRILGNTAAAQAISKMLNESPEEEARSMVYVDAFLDHILASANEREHSYVRSRSVAAMIHQQPGLDGIAYPSVPDPLGRNFAILPDAAAQKLRAVCSQLVRIKRLHRFGYVDYEVLQDVERLDSSGRFVWKPANAGLQRRFNLTEEEATEGITFSDSRTS